MKLYRIKKSNIDRRGRGLYAAKDIIAGTKIIDYVGNIITKKQTENSDKFDNAKPIYLFNLNSRYDLDGAVSWNLARLINHSCSNNCDYEGKGLKIWIITIRDINREFGWRLPDENASTIAGLIFYEIKTIPEPGQIFSFYGFRFEILRAKKNHIELIKATSLN